VPSSPFVFAFAPLLLLLLLSVEAAKESLDSSG
jgi:hypothetical protein